MCADLAYAFKWPLSELRELDLDDLARWHKEALRYYQTKGK